MIELKPLETLFSKISDEKIPIYCKQLKQFDISVIRLAVDRVCGKWDRLSFPPPGVIVTECSAVAGKGARGAMTQDGTMPHEKRQHDISTLVSDYIQRFKTNSSILTECKANETDDSLMRYVREVACIQAQIINRHPDGRIALSWCLLEPEEKPENIEKWRWQFLRDCSDQARKGVIDVSIPTGKLREWSTLARLNAEYKIRNQPKTGYSASVKETLQKVHEAMTAS